jgi:hypothetical protein
MKSDKKNYGTEEWRSRLHFMADGLTLKFKIQFCCRQ